jgi:hypothetical protein
MATKACQQSAWRGHSKHAGANASISHWPFVCRPHEAGHAWGGLQHLFGGRAFKEVAAAQTAEEVYWLRALQLVYCKI